jgi:branched-chain amino acid transport system permease protein
VNAQQLINGISVGAVYSLIAVGFALIFNVLKFSNFAHGGMIAVTAYVGYHFASTYNTNLIATVLLAALAGGLLGIVIEFVGFRSIRKSQGPLVYYFVSSITLGILMENLITVYRGKNFYAFPKFFDTSTIQWLGYNISVVDLTIFIVSVTMLTLLMLILTKTKLGLAVRAAALDVNTSCLMGVSPNVIIAVTFFVAGALAGVSGVFLGISYTLYPQLGKIVVKGFIASVIGGLGSLSGAVIGAFLLGITEILLIASIGSSLSPVIIFVITLVFLMVRPRGISGILIPEKA